MARDTYASIESTADQAESLVAQGRYAEAERHYRELVGQTHVIDYEYDDWLRRLADIYRQLQRRRDAGFIYLYLHYFDLARESFPGEAGLAPRARILEVETHGGPGPAGHRPGLDPLVADANDRPGQAEDALRSGRSGRERDEQADREDPSHDYRVPNTREYR